ncbi:recombinase family protein [Bradyrhizobium sp. 155]|uniref:recombinase family protein n=1 Tax=Bradyrhizobium sp. 155 TaxID=2782629 RepID=UPI002000185B|nr:recombinase family protein [Bradyrhizobium sp. 155]
MRKAILYVRQSSAHQLLHNRESSALQYAMRDRLTVLGWSEIEVIDDDLRRSAAGGVQRAGFERMVAEVCLGKVGAVCAREVSRFARNSRDWQQLIEMCRVVRYRSGRSGDNLCAEARQRPPAARAQGQPQRVRAGSVASALALGPLREGAPGRVNRGGARRLREGRGPL